MIKVKNLKSENKCKAEPFALNLNTLSRNKRGVIRIIESVLAILIILGVVLLLINKQPSTKGDFAASVYKVESQVLFEVANNNALRTAVLNASYQPVDCFIQSRLGKFSLDFNTSISDPGESNQCNAPLDKELYTDDIIISTNITDRNFNPKKLLMCAWVGKLTDRECPFCGDRIVTSYLGEQCDDGNTIGGDGCSSTCQTEGGGCTPNWQCTAWTPATCPITGIQTRTCTDSNGCGILTGKPAESQGCTYTPLICPSPEGKIIFVSGSPYQSASKIYYKAQKIASVASGTFAIKVFNSAGTVIGDGFTNALSFADGISIIKETLSWPVSGSVITIYYGNNCQDKYIVP